MDLGREGKGESRKNFIVLALFACSATISMQFSTKHKIFNPVDVLEYGMK